MLVVDGQKRTVSSQIADHARDKSNIGYSQRQDAVENPDPSWYVTHPVAKMQRYYLVMAKLFMLDSHISLISLPTNILAAGFNGHSAYLPSSRHI